jgi:hypothetical protein
MADEANALIGKLGNALPPERATRLDTIVSLKNPVCIGS